MQRVANSVMSEMLEPLVAKVGSCGACSGARWRHSEACNSRNRTTNLHPTHQPLHPTHTSACLQPLQAMKPYESAAVPESERIEQGAEELEARFRWAPRQLPSCAVLCFALL